MTTKVQERARSERERVGRILKGKRRSERNIAFEPCRDRKRRAELESRTPEWLQWYLPVWFSEPFTDDELEWIAEIETRATEGGDKALAAQRGGGKTTIAMGVTLKLMLEGLLTFPVITSATGPDATRLLGNMKFEVEFNERLSDQDIGYPELCTPVIALEGATLRQRMQTIEDERTHLVWEKDMIVFPTIPEKYSARCSGSVLMTRGLDSAVRGLNYRGKRPDFVLIDDPETRDSAKSLSQCTDRERAIERDLAGLGGRGKQIGRLMLCTLQNREPCISAKYTDPLAKPSWCGKRYRAVKKWPDNRELWDEYLDILRAGWQSGKDQDGVKATEFYAARRSPMDAGAEVSNPHRFIAGKELSAIQSCYNTIARIGLESFLTEYQNDPPEDSGPQESGITPAIVAGRLSGFARHEVPADCTVATAFIDLGKYGCHWSVTGWRKGAIGFVIDYGVAEVFNMGKAVTDKTVDRAILTALRNWREEIEKTPFTRAGERIKLDLVLVDSGDFTDAAYAFCLEAGPPFYPAKGFGQGRFYPGVTNHSKGHIAGVHWYTQIQPIGVKLFGLDADHWKRHVHALFLTETFDKAMEFRAGTLSLFSPGNDKRCHQTFSHHICAEIWTEEPTDKGLRRGFKSKSPNNHWLDSISGNCAAADYCGIRVVGEPKPQRRYVPLDQMGKKVS